MTRRLRDGVTALAAFVLLVGVAGCAARKVYGENTLRIATAVGQDVVIKLASNPTTGYDWQIGGSPDPRIAALIESDYELPRSPAPGAGGQRRWTFRAVGPGTTTIRFDYARPWERTPPEKSTTFTITVQ